MPYTEVMHKWGEGELHSGSKHGPTVPKTKAGQKQAVAIMLSEKRKGTTDADPQLKRYQVTLSHRTGGPSKVKEFQASSPEHAIKIARKYVGTRGIYHVRNHTPTAMDEDPMMANDPTDGERALDCWHNLHKLKIIRAHDADYPSTPGGKTTHKTMNAAESHAEHLQKNLGHEGVHITHTKGSNRMNRWPLYFVHHGQPKTSKDEHIEGQDAGWSDEERIAHQREHFGFATGLGPGQKNYKPSPRPVTPPKKINKVTASLLAGRGKLSKAYTTDADNPSFNPAYRWPEGKVPGSGHKLTPREAVQEKVRNDPALRERIKQAYLRNHPPKGQDATWHQNRSKAPLYHPTKWSVIHDPPNAMRSAHLFNTEEEAKAHHAKNPQHSYILKPQGGSKDEHIGFKKLEGELAHKKGVSNPAAVAAAIGEKKYGKEGMAKKAAAGRAHDGGAWSGPHSGKRAQRVGQDAEPRGPIKSVTTPRMKVEYHPPASHVNATRPPRNPTQGGGLMTGGPKVGQPTGRSQEQSKRASLRDLPAVGSGVKSNKPGFFPKKFVMLGPKAHDSAGSCSKLHMLKRPAQDIARVDIEKWHKTGRLPPKELP